MRPLRQPGRGRPIDLSGMRFGRLLVQAATGRSNPSRGLEWRCLCDCGVTECIPASYLPHRARANPKKTVTACRSCRLGKVCAVCSRAFESKVPKVCCSPACKRIHKRRQQDDWVAAAMEIPAYRERMREMFRRLQAQARADPDRNARIQANSRNSRGLKALARLAQVGAELEKKVTKNE